eukprot:553115_1
MRPRILVDPTPTAFPAKRLSNSDIKPLLSAHSFDITVTCAPVSTNVLTGAPSTSHSMNSIPFPFLGLLLLAVPCSFKDVDDEHFLPCFLWSYGFFIGDTKPQRGVGYGELIEAIASIFAILMSIPESNAAARLSAGCTQELLDEGEDKGSPTDPIHSGESDTAFTNHFPPPEKTIKKPMLDAFRILLLDKPFIAAGDTSCGPCSLLYHPGTPFTCYESQLDEILPAKSTGRGHNSITAPRVSSYELWRLTCTEIGCSEVC